MVAKNRKNKYTELADLKKKPTIAHFHDNVELWVS